MILMLFVPRRATYGTAWCLWLSGTLRFSYPDPADDVMLASAWSDRGVASSTYISLSIIVKDCAAS